MNSTLLKTDMLTKCKAFNRSNKAKLRAKHLGFVVNEETPVFVSEQLTPRASRLYFLARNLIKSTSFTFCWTAYGNVYVRKNENSPIVTITNENQIKQLFGSAWLACNIRARIFSFIFFGILFLGSLNRAITCYIVNNFHPYSLTPITNRFKTSCIHSNFTTQKITTHSHPFTFTTNTPDIQEIYKLTHTNQIVPFFLIARFHLCGGLPHEM